MLRRLDIGKANGHLNRTATAHHGLINIKRGSDIVDGSSSTSIERSAGVSQMGEAVTPKDQVTQQNATLVDESAAAAERLKGQALALLQVVAQFKLNLGEARQAAVTRIAAAVSRHPTAAPRRPNRTQNKAQPTRSVAAPG